MDIEFSPEWFDASSKAWMSNKKKCENATYVYVCKKKGRGGHLCGRRVYKEEEYCWNHRSNFF